MGFDNVIQDTKDTLAKYLEVLVTHQEDLNDDALKFTANPLLSFRSLRSLLYGTGITDNGLCYLSKALAALPEMTSLGINVLNSL